MQAKSAGIFVAGVAVGMASLTLALWWSGALHLTPVSAGSRVMAPAVMPTPAIPPAEPPKVVTPDGLAANAPPAAALNDPPAYVPPPAPPNSGLAALPPASAPNVGPPGLPHLAMPIAGLNPATLHDTFNDKRDGHKHEALDIPAPRGTPVHAVAQGKVVKLFTSKPGGLTVYQFDDHNAYSFYYAHLDRYASGLKEGTMLQTGDVLGFVGSTGDASPNAPHLHFAVNRLGADKKWWEGVPIDPLPLLKAGR